LVVCDEGHLLKNEKTSLSQSMNRVRTRRRIVLTGTPLQNNLKECKHHLQCLLKTLCQTNPHWARVVGYYSPFSLCVIHKEGLCPTSGDINRLMMMSSSGY
jgi:hypothetical protein